MEPVTSPSPIARAPSMVAIRNAVRASSAVGSPLRPFATNAAKRISSTMSSVLLLAVPSVPNPTVMPALMQRSVSAMPLPSFRLLLGQ